MLTLITYLLWGTRGATRRTAENVAKSTAAIERRHREAMAIQFAAMTDEQQERVVQMQRQAQSRAIKRMVIILLVLGLGIVELMTYCADRTAGDFNPHVITHQP